LKRLYSNIPRFYAADFYRVAAGEFIKKYAAHKDVLSIYVFGQVSVEGISDLDFLVVLKEPLTQPFDDQYSVATFDRDLRYIYNNTQPFIMSEEIFRNFWKIFPTDDLRLVYGKEIAREGKDKTESQLYDVLILMDVCSHFYPNVFMKQLFSKDLNVRYSLLVLNALKFPLRVFADIAGFASAPWTDYIGRVKRLRKNWFQMEERKGFERIIEMLEEAAVVSIDLMSRMHFFIREHYWLSKGSNICAFKPLSKYFIEPFDKDRSLLKTLETYKRQSRWDFYLPQTFYLPLLVYGLEEGAVSEHIRRHLSVKRNFFNVSDEGLYYYMKDRISLMNGHAAFYKRNGIAVNMVHNYYGHDPLAPQKRSFPFSDRIYGLLHRLVRRGVI
jgi:hypothetical protein